jgi:hypothetical protein
MGSASSFQRARLVVAVLSAPGFTGFAPGERFPFEDELAESFGVDCERGPDLDFGWSDYYDEEMGGSPRRGFLAYSRLVDPADLASIKARTNAVEERWALEGRRRCNLDPGLLYLSRFSLATTKDRPHRVPLAEGIFAEVTLIYERGDFRPLPWTYPDWASEEYRSFLRSQREGLKRQLRSLALPVHGASET